ncbi:MAG TPA: carboxypeptidase-like regulatory domain-containing protein [Jatrophihabitantaceae bacterium]
MVFATGKGYSFTLKTDAKGSYAFWAPSSGNPITLTASASGWIAQNQKVNIRIGKTTTVNFTLRPVTC